LVLPFDIDRFLADKPLAITMAGLEELKRPRRSAPRSPSTPTHASSSETLAAERASRSPAGPRPMAATGVIPIRGTISQHAGRPVRRDLFGGGHRRVAGPLRRHAGRRLNQQDRPRHRQPWRVQLRRRRAVRTRSQAPAAEADHRRRQQPGGQRRLLDWRACDQFFVTPGGLVGSIGVYSMHQDISKRSRRGRREDTFISAGKHKVDGNQFEPLGDETRQRIQERVDEVYDQFVHDVARGRGVPREPVTQRLRRRRRAHRQEGQGRGHGRRRDDARRRALEDVPLSRDRHPDAPWLMRASSGSGLSMTSPLTPDDEDDEPPKTEAKPACPFRFRAKAAAAGAA
jgi:hypothetical protein